MDAVFASAMTGHGAEINDFIPSAVVLYLLLELGVFHDELDQAAAKRLVSAQLSRAVQNIGGACRSDKLGEGSYARSSRLRCNSRGSSQ